MVLPAASCNVIGVVVAEVPETIKAVHPMLPRFLKHLKNSDLFFKFDVKLYLCLPPVLGSGDHQQWVILR